MAGPITSGVVEIKSYAQIQESPAVEKRATNVWHYSHPGFSNNPVDPNTIITVFQSNVLQPMCALLHVDYKVIETGVRYLDDTRNIETLSTTSFLGSKTGARLPAYASVCYQLKTTLRGRNWRGSKHITPIAEADTDDDVVAAASVAAFKAWGNNLTAGLNCGAVTLVPCILSRNLSQLLTNPVTIQAAPVASFLMNLTLGTLRKRREKTEIA